MLQNGAEIRLTCPVQKVVIVKGRVSGVQTECGLEHFDTVISTIPLPFVPRILPDLEESILNQYRSVNNIAVVCVIVKLRNPLSENFWINTNDDDMDIPGLVEYSNLRPLQDTIVYVPYYLPGDNALFAASDDVFAEKVKRQIARIKPEIDETEFLDIRVSRYRFAQPICEPGFLDKLPPVKLPVDGLWVADTSYYYPEDRGISESIDFGRNMARDATKC